MEKHDIESERIEFEAWYQHHHGDRAVYVLDESGEYADKQVQGAFNIWQARAAIEADRKRKSEPWGWTVLGVTYPTNWTYVGDSAERSAKSAAKELGDGFVAAPLFLGTAPQPAEPVAWQQLMQASEEMAHASHVIAGTVERNRLLKAIEAVKSAQPAEPVKSHLKVSYDDKFDCLYVDCNDSDESIDAEEDDKGILYHYAASDGRLIGITISNFMGPHAK